MKAIQVTGPRRLQLIEAPVPEPDEGEVLVKLEALSVCGTDMMLYRHAGTAHLAKGLGWCYVYTNVNRPPFGVYLAI